jgi:hypothetical protein
MHCEIVLIGRCGGREGGKFGEKGLHPLLAISAPSRGMLGGSGTTQMRANRMHRQYNTVNNRSQADNRGGVR